VADLLEQASAWLDGMRKTHLSRTVTYQRPSTGSGQAAEVEVAATIGKTVFEIDDGSGAVVQWESRDFLITAVDLVLAGEVVAPQAGDRIRETQDGRAYVYEVMAPGKEPCWRYSDPYRKTLRVHTKQVGTEDA
jgi:hypothetical protein